MSKPNKYSMETIRRGGKFSYGPNANVKTTSLPGKGCPEGAKGKPR